MRLLRRFGSTLATHVCCFNSSAGILSGQAAAVVVDAPVGPAVHSPCVHSPCVYSPLAAGTLEREVKFEAQLYKMRDGEYALDFQVGVCSASLVRLPGAVLAGVVARLPGGLLFCKLPPCTVLCFVQDAGLGSTRSTSRWAAACKLSPCTVCVSYKMRDGEYSLDFQVGCYSVDFFQPGLARARASSGDCRTGFAFVGPCLPCTRCRGALRDAALPHPVLTSGTPPALLAAPLWRPLLVHGHLQQPAERAAPLAHHGSPAGGVAPRCSPHRQLASCAWQQLPGTRSIGPQCMT